MSANALATALLVWLPIIALFALVTLGLAAFYVIEIAFIVGIWPRKWRWTGQATAADSRRQQLVAAGLTIFGLWASLALRYAKNESPYFVSLLPDSTRMNSAQAWIAIVVLTAWIPLVPIVKAVERRRHRRERKKSKDAAARATASLDA